MCRGEAESRSTSSLAPENVKRHVKPNHFSSAPLQLLPLQLQLQLQLLMWAFCHTLLLLLPPRVPLDVALVYTLPVLMMLNCERFSGSSVVLQLCPPSLTQREKANLSQAFSLH